MRAQDRRAGCNRVSLLSKVAQYVVVNAGQQAAPPPPPTAPTHYLPDNIVEDYEPKPWWRRKWVLPTALALGAGGLGVYYGNRRGRVRGYEKGVDTALDAFMTAGAEQADALAAAGAAGS